MTNNKTIVNGNPTDDEIFKKPQFVVVDLDDPKNNYIKPYLYCDTRFNSLIGDDWVLYTNGCKSVKKPIMIRNGVEIIQWIWRNFSILSSRGFFSTSYDLHNYIRFKEEGRLIFGESPGAHIYALYHREYRFFIDLAFSYSELWVANSRFRTLWGLSFRTIPYFTQCFSSIQDFWVVKNGGIKLIDWASVFYYLYLRDKYGERAADSGIAKLKEFREVYYDKQ